MTEDMIEQKTDLLENIGTSDDAANIRAQIQSEQLFSASFDCFYKYLHALISDMQAFKAANPHAELEDFVRWYSPRDWMEDDHGVDGRAGHLSARMSKQGNLWQNLWKVWYLPLTILLICYIRNLEEYQALDNPLFSTLLRKAKK